MLNTRLIKIGMTNNNKGGLGKGDDRNVKLLMVYNGYFIQRMTDNNEGGLVIGDDQQQ